MSVEKSFMVAKAYRDLEEFAKSFELAPTHVGSISAGQRYCDNGSCATCIKQASRDKNARQTHSHVTKGYLVSVEKGLPSALKSKTSQELGQKASAMIERAHEAYKPGGPHPFKVDSALGEIAVKHKYGLMARESMRAGDKRQAQIWIGAGREHKRRSPANYNGWMKPGKIENSDAGQRMKAIREKRLARQQALAAANPTPTISQQNKPSW